MNTISTQVKHMPEFVCKTTSIRHEPANKYDPFQPLIGLYLLRIALGLKDKMPELLLEELFEDYMGELTGLGPGNSNNSCKISDDEVINDDSTSQAIENLPINSLYKQIDERLNQLLVEGMPLDTPLITNSQWLTEELCLSACDQELLVLSLLIKGNRKFKDYLSHCRTSFTETYFIDFLHVMTTRPIHELEQSLHPDSPLCRIGWLNAKETLNTNQLVMPPSLLYSLFNDVKSPDILRQVFFQPVKPTTLQADAYPLLVNDIEVLAPYLKAALERKQTGVNVLIYGASAPGKRELARILAKCVGSQLYEVAEASPSGNPWEPLDRFAACQFTGAWLAQHDTSGLIMMSDAGQLLPQNPSLSYLDEETDNKAIDLALIKRHMKTNPVPIIWIIGKRTEIDTACLREFSYALKVDKMPERLRLKRIIRATRNLTVTQSWQQHLAKHSRIPLSHIKKAATIAELSQNTAGKSAEDVMMQVLNSHSHLFNRGEAITRHRFVTGYDLNFSNTSTSLKSLLKGLRQHPRGNFCFYGASGTGKTAFAKHLAEQLGLPLTLKRASDILCMYVGESEKNMAHMFHEAQQEGAILLLDEADSLLSDRRDADKNWEVSQINEMLIHMEAFQGIFICTTNLMERMDAASLRRFDFKVRFDYLNAEQRWALFVQESQHLGVSLPNAQAELNQLKQHILRLTKLTPGDFAVLNRQARFNSEPLDLSTIQSILQQECLAKGENFNTIGFVH